MADVTYPAMLPDFLIDSYGYDDDDDLVRTDMEGGPARVRRRTRQNGTVFNVSSSMTYTQFKIFEAWYRYKLENGVKWFDVNLAVGSGIVTHTARFKGKWSTRLSGPKRWIITAKLDVEERKTMTEAELDVLMPPVVTGIHVSGIEIDETGNVMTVIFDSLPDAGADGINHFTMNKGWSVSGTLSGTNRVQYTLGGVILEGDDIVVAYNQPGDGIKAKAGGILLESFTGFHATNKSTVTAPVQLSWPCLDNAGNSTVVCSENPLYNADVINGLTASPDVTSGIQTGSGFNMNLHNSYINIVDIETGGAVSFDFSVSYKVGATLGASDWCLLAILVFFPDGGWGATYENQMLFYWRTDTHHIVSQDGTSGSSVVNFEDGTERPVRFSYVPGTNRIVIDVYETSGIPGWVNVGEWPVNPMHFGSLSFSVCTNGTANHWRGTVRDIGYKRTS